MPWLPDAGELEHVAVANEVGAHIGLGVFEAVAHPGLRTEMDDSLDFYRVGETGERLRIGKIDPFEAKAIAELMLEVVEAGLF